MIIFRDISSWLTFRKSLNAQKIGLVATMGNLHLGHQSLLQRSKRENDCSIVTIFVNPTQFNQSEDFEKYPRTIEADLKLLQDCGIDYCLLPTLEDIYPQGYNFSVQENNVSLILEGEKRPGHFNGVLTIVMKLFNLVRPNCAYFGEKDFQQYQLIKTMSADFFMDIDILLCPTIRESSGLAFSSRNNRLSASARQQAENFAKIFQQKKDINLISEELAENNFTVDYLVDYQNRRYAAVIVEGVRLIDNYDLSSSY